MERRVENRTETNVLLTCRVPARPYRAVMHDVSLEGCRLELPDANTELGGTALIDLPGAAQYPGRVMWVSGTQMGIRFHRRLRGAPAIALGLEQPEPEPVEPEPVAQPQPEGLLRHWIRRLTGRLA